MLRRLLNWWHEWVQDWKNMHECSRWEQGYECRGRKCKGRLPH